MKKLQITASSNVGLVRTNNEDMILVRNKYVRDEDYETEIDLTICDRLVVAVADGMGGGGGEPRSADKPAFLPQRLTRKTLRRGFQRGYCRLDKQHKQHCQLTRAQR